MPLTTETLLAYSMGIIGTLLVLLISLVVYVFLTLREEVRGVSSDLSELNKHRVKLVHIDDCRLTVARVHERLDDYEDAMQGSANAWPGPRRCCRSGEGIHEPELFQGDPGTGNPLRVPEPRRIRGIRHA